MLTSAILQAAMGIGLVYILLALVCSVFNEWIARIARMRPYYLKREVHKLLVGTLAAEFEKHPLISAMMEQGKYPQYLPSSTVALAVIDLGYTFKPGHGGLPGSTHVKRGWSATEREFLESLRLHATNVSALQGRIEKWFDLGMEQTTGRYKRATQLIIAGAAAVLVGAANVDTIAIAGKLYWAAANNRASELIIGWKEAPDSWLLKSAGLVLTWAAASLGAPFWFDMLNKLVNLRQTGLPPDEDKRARSGLVAQ